MPNLLGILETSLYVEEFERACAFYEQVLGLNSIYRDPRLCAYDVGGRGVLLLFLRGRRWRPCSLPAAPSRRMTVTARCTSLFRLLPMSSPNGRRSLEEALTWKSKAAPNGRAAARAFTFAIPTDISLNSRRRVFGRGFVCSPPPPGPRLGAPGGRPLAGEVGVGVGQEVKSRPPAQAARSAQGSLHRSRGALRARGLPCQQQHVVTTGLDPVVHADLRLG